MSAKKVKLATPEESAFFADKDRVELHERTSKILRTWEAQLDPKTIYYLPISLDPVEGGAPVRRLYMEAPRDDEPWLSGVIVAFQSEEELEVYLELICEVTGAERESFDFWKGNIISIHKTLAKIDTNWKATGQEGVRCELHEVSDRGTIQYVDDLFDQTTV